MTDPLGRAEAEALVEEAGRVATAAALQAGPVALRQLAGKRDYLAAMIETFATRLGLAVADLSHALNELPRPD